MASYLIITVCYSHKDNLLMLYLYIGVFISGMITNTHLFKHTFDVVSLISDEIECTVGTNRSAISLI